MRAFWVIKRRYGMVKCLVVGTATDEPTAVALFDGHSAKRNLVIIDVFLAAASGPRRPQGRGALGEDAGACGTSAWSSAPIAFSTNPTGSKP